MASRKKASRKTANPLDPRFLDLTEVVEAAKRKHGWSNNMANHAELWYRRFLIVSQRQSTESGTIAAVVGIEDTSDDLWHEHISQTVKYRTDCEKMFGGFLDHTPKTPNLWQMTVNDAERLYLDAFGVAPPFLGVCCI